METERLYYDDAYLTEFDARVCAVRQDGWIALDRSAFYPTSGGQPFDTGTLAWDGETVHVTDVEVGDGTVWHRVDGPVPVGREVHGQIDWERRFDHMQQHAADHMLAGAAWQLFQGVTIGLHLGKEDSTIDLTLPGGRTRLTEEEEKLLEDTVNRRVQRDDPIRCWFPAPDEIAALPLRKQPTVAEHVRVVAMGDYEMVPCGGTHPATTGQIGPVKILSTDPARGKMRLRFVSGMRAVRVFQQAVRCADRVSAALSAEWADAFEALEKERANAAALRKEMSQRLLTAAVAMILESGQGSVRAVHLPFADRETLIRAASEWTREEDHVALLSCPQGAGRALVFARGCGVQTDMAALLRASGARGGGKSDLAQGSAPDGEALQRAKTAAMEGNA